MAATVSDDRTILRLEAEWHDVVVIVVETLGTLQGREWERTGGVHFRNLRTGYQRQPYSAE
jgi:hypothetical protein